MNHPLPGLPPCLTQLTRNDRERIAGNPVGDGPLLLNWRVLCAPRSIPYRDQPWTINTFEYEQRLCELTKEGFTVHSILADGTIVAYKYVEEETCE